MWCKCDGVEENVYGDEKIHNSAQFFEWLQVWEGWSEVSANYSVITNFFPKYFSNILS